MKKKAVIYGLGKGFEAQKKALEGIFEIVGVSDRKRREREDYVAPEDIHRLDFDCVYVTSLKFYEEIKRELTGCGIAGEKILSQEGLSAYEKLQMQMTGLCESARKAEEYQEKNLFLNARSFAGMMRGRKIASLEEAEFQVFSQFGEDGIIQWLLHHVSIGEKTFIEFGVEDYSEANTRFLLMNNNWTGLVMDGSEENISRLNAWKYLWKYDLLTKAVFITKENINSTIVESGVGEGDIGLLSIDLDGNDYWILNAIDCVQPRIVICEYNNLFGLEPVSVPYDETFVRTEKHYSNLYWGASLGAFLKWAEKNGYYYMGSNSAGNKAFFVRKDCISAEMVPANAHIFVESRYRESRGKGGELTYLRGGERLACIKDMELVNVETGRMDTIANIYHLQ